MYKQMQPVTAATAASEAAADDDGEPVCHGDAAAATRRTASYPLAIADASRASSNEVLFYKKKLLFYQNYC